MIRYTPDQMAALQRKIEQSADESLSRHGIPDPDGRLHARLVRYSYEHLDEWALCIDFR